MDDSFDFHHSDDDILEPGTPEIPSIEIINDPPICGITPDLPSTEPVTKILEEGPGLVWDEPHTNTFNTLTNGYALEIHGNPFIEIENFDAQDEPYSCAIATTNMIFNSFGYDFGEDFFSDVFETLDIYDSESGTSPYFIDDAINAFAEVNGLGLTATELHGFTIEDLQTQLDTGNKILVALDSFEFENDYTTLNEVRNIPDSGHAVQLTGIINSENGSFAIINDPAYPEGAGATIPMDRFMNACNDFDFTAVSVSKNVG